MSVLIIKTKSQQKLEYFETLKRPLTAEESDDLQRTMHSVYAYERTQAKLTQNRAEELKLLEKLRREALMPSPLG
jgi:hypothetical protein